MGWGGGSVPALEKALEDTEPLHGRSGAGAVSHSRAPALPSSWSTGITHPLTVLTGKGGLVQFFLHSTFCLSIDRADGNLSSQLPSVPI